MSSQRNRSPVPGNGKPKEQKVPRFLKLYAHWCKALISKNSLVMLKVYLVMLDHANKEGVCFPSKETIRIEAGLQDARQVRSAVAKLLELGAIQELSKRRKRVKLYRMMPPPNHQRNRTLESAYDSTKPDFSRDVTGPSNPVVTGLPGPGESESENQNQKNQRAEAWKSDVLNGESQQTYPVPQISDPQLLHTPHGRNELFHQIDASQFFAPFQALGRHELQLCTHGLAAKAVHNTRKGGDPLRYFVTSMQQFPTSCQRLTLQERTTAKQEAARFQKPANGTPRLYLKSPENRETPTEQQQERRKRIALQQLAEATEGEDNHKPGT